MLRPVHDASDGVDGYVSIEVSPLLARDTDGTAASARHLHELIDEPNLYVKIPGTAEGRVVFCCEDYDEIHTVGDLATQTVDEILSGDEMARLRRLAYGIDDAPENFICRNCLFALTD